MLTAILIDHETRALQALDSQLRTYCPEVTVKQKIDCLELSFHALEKECPDLVFVDIQNPHSDERSVLKQLKHLDCAVIVVTERKQYALDAFKCGIAGYILKPVLPEELQEAVKNVHRRFGLRPKQNDYSPHVASANILKQSHQKIGVPTLKGYDFIPVSEIIRCEGLQKCTRVVTVERSNIVSSYNLGEFRKLLEPYGFFLSHKSHLINLSYVKQYYREGVIKLCDESSVPISRRKKTEFLATLPHL